MTKEAWDLPLTEESRDRLLELVDQYRATGMQRELACSLTRLGHFAKHFGGPAHEQPFVASHLYALEAVRILREVGDERELAIALRIAAVPLIGVDCPPLLEESLEIARRIGDREQEAWTLFRMTRFDGVEGVTVQDAMNIFEEIDHPEGVATCLVVTAISPGEPVKFDFLERAVVFYERAGNEIEAARARSMIEMLSR